MAFTSIFGYIKNVINVARGDTVNFRAFFAIKPMVVAHYIIASLCVTVMVSFGFLILLITGVIIPIITMSFTILMACFLVIYPYLALTGQLEKVARPETV